MSLVKRPVQLADSITIDCWIVRTVDEYGNDQFWFNGHDIASFLGYDRPNNAILTHVKCKWKKQWRQLKGTLFQGTLHLPSNWQPQAVFISEPGLYALVTRSKMPEAEKFTDWVYEEVLPALRRNEQFKLEMREKENEIKQLADGLLEANRALISANAELIKTRHESENARHDAVVLSHRLADIAQDVIAKPKSEGLLHTLLKYLI